MSARRPNRQLAGTPIGGQFAPSPKLTPGYELDADDDDNPEWDSPDDNIDGDPGDLDVDLDIDDPEWGEGSDDADCQAEGAEPLPKAERDRLDSDDTLAWASNTLAHSPDAAGRIFDAGDLAAEMWLARGKLEAAWRARGQWEEHPDGAVTVDVGGSIRLTWRQPGGRLTRRAHAIAARVAARQLLRVSTGVPTNVRRGIERARDAGEEPSSEAEVAADRVLGITSIDASPIDLAAVVDEQARVDAGDVIARAVERIHPDRRESARRVVAADLAQGGHHNIAAIARTTGIPEETVRRRFEEIRRNLGDSSSG